MDAASVPARFRASRLATVLSLLLAAPAASDALPLRDLWALALSGSPELAAAAREAETAEAGVRRSEADRAPLLSLFSRGTRYSAPHRIHIPAGVIDENPRNFDVGDEWAYQVTVLATQDLYTGGATRARIAVAEGERSSGRARRDGTREDLLLAVTRAAFDLRRALAVEGVLREERRQAEGHLAQARGFLEDHLVTRLDLLEAEGRVAEVERRLLSAGTAAADSRARLNRLLGRPLERPVDVADEEPFPGPVPALDECVRAALTARPEVVAARGAVERAAGGESLARSLTRPRVSLYGSYTLGADPAFLTSDPSFWSVGATLTWTLFDAGRRAAEAEKASSSRSASGVRLKGAEEDASLAVLLAHRAVREREEILASLEASVGGAREGLRLARERYAEGLGRGLDVLDAQARWARTEMELRGARIEVQFARARLLHAVGTLSSALGTEAGSRASGSSR